MTNMEKWNKIVELHVSNKYSREAIIQRIWESIFSELLGYATLFGEIDAQRTIQIGSTERAVTDIIIKDKDIDLFIVEIKQATLDTGEKQLLSYLKLLHIGIGVLVNRKITIFAYDYKRQDHEQIKHEICFDLDSIDGEFFVELFSKPFQLERAREFIIQRNSSHKHVREIKRLINKEYIFGLLYTELSNSFDHDEIKKALEEIEISINEKNQNTKTIGPGIGGGKGPVGHGSNHIKIGQAVREFFSKVSRDNSFSEELIRKLCEKDYCRQRFSINREVLKEVIDLSKIDAYRKDINGYSRYYKELYRYNGKNYILCSQWTTTQEPYFYQWVNFFEANIINT